MRTLLLVLLLACGFGVAAIWQQQRTARLREERALAGRVASGDVVMTPSGLLEPGQAVLVIGMPAAPTQPSADDKTVAVPGVDGVNKEAPVQPAGPTVPPQKELGDFTVEVASGQSLSKIAHDHYGHAPLELVRKLAEYNKLASADALRAGMQLKLPPLERLGVVLKP